METAERERSITRDLLTLAAAVVVIVGMKFLATVIVPVLSAVFLFVAFRPMLRWLEQKGVRLLWAKAIVIATVMVGALLAAALIAVSVAQISADVPAKRAELRERIDALASDLSAVGIDVSGVSLGAQFDLQLLVRLAVGFLPGIITAISAGAIALIIFMYAVADADGVGRRLRLGLGADDEQVSKIELTMAMMGDYIKIRALLGAAIALANLVVLLLVGVEYALLWALVAFAMSFIPYVGYWIALVPPFLLAFIDGGWLPALIVFFGYWAINGAIDNLVGPRMLGHGVNIAPAVTVISVVFWGFVLGPVGAILAMPLTVGFKLLLLERNPDSRWLALLVSARDQDPHAIGKQDAPGFAATQPGE